MVIEQKGIEGLSYSIDQHNKYGECFDNCILLHINDRVILRFETLDELRKAADDIKFDDESECEIFKEKLGAVVNEIVSEYGEF